MQKVGFGVCWCEWQKCVIIQVDFGYSEVHRLQESTIFSLVGRKKTQPSKIEVKSSNQNLCGWGIRASWPV